MSKKLKSGDKFGRLTVMFWQKESKTWRCKCDCGKETNSRSWSLKTGRHKSCGCKLKEPRLNKRLPNNLGLKRQIIRSYKRSAKNRKYDWKLTEKEAIDYIESDCYYCGIEPNTIWRNRPKGSTKHDDPNRFIFYNGIDRVDNSIGYTKENTVSCCSICNNSKSTLSVKEWKQWLLRVSQKMFNDYPEMEYTQASGNGRRPDSVIQDEDIV